MQDALFRFGFVTSLTTISDYLFDHSWWNLIPAILCVCGTTLISIANEINQKKKD